jgi:hypothetical protein
VNKILLIVVIFFSHHLVGQINAPKYSNEFLNIGVGARSLAMSNAVITSTEGQCLDIGILANLANTTNDIQIGLMHAEYFAGIANMILAASLKKLTIKVVLDFLF